MFEEQGVGLTVTGLSLDFLDAIGHSIATRPKLFC
jgi:hypothetical protein